MYQCEAKNDLDTRYSSGQLKVLTLAPSFTKRPLEERIFAAEQGNVTIVCDPEAAPLPNITWYFNDKLIGSGGKHEIYQNGNLQITSLNSADSGVWECRAKNKYGNARSRTDLQVIRGPSFDGSETQKPNPRMIVNKGETVSLKCKASTQGSELLDMAYYWRLNDIPIQFVQDYEKQRILELKNAGGSRINLKRRSEVISWDSYNDKTPGLNSHWINNGLEYKNKGTGDFQKFRRGKEFGDLTVKNITIAEAGKYECGVETVVGTIYGTSQVIVHAPPGPPGGVTAVELTANSGTVVWTDGAFYGFRITSYRIEGKTEHNSTWIVLADQVEG